jgi:hypothetical protein
MDASKAMKAAKTAKPADPASLPPLQEHKTSGLRGRVEGLDFSARQAILESEDRVAIAYGSLGSPLILQEKVNVALLRHCTYHISNGSTSAHWASQTKLASF